MPNDKFIKSLENGKAYDYIANNYWTMTKEELAHILKEYIYASSDDVEQEVLENLKSEQDFLEDVYGI